MSYRLIYTVPFASLDNEDCVVEIEKEGYSGEVIELTGGSSPFTVDIEDEEFLYTPTRFSTATIRIVGNDYLQSLFTIAYQQYRVTFKRNGVVTWCGFIKPELYTQDYTSETFELELECMSAMSALEFIDYSQAGENRVFVSLWDLLKKCISSAKGQYIEIYIPHVYGPDEIEYNSENNILEEMTISEQNFFDEDDKPMKLKEVLEEICKFLNWTCVDWRGELYFVDIDHLGEFRRHNTVSYDWEGSTASPELNNIQRIGFAGSNNSLDILPGFNKVTVKCSNYCFNNVISEEDFKKMKPFTKRKTYNYKQYYETRQYLKNQSFKLTRYSNRNSNKNDTVLINEDETNVYIDDPTNNYLGGYCTKRCLYEIKDGNPNIIDYNWEYLYEFKLVSDYTYSYPSTVPPTGDEKEDPDWKPPMITSTKQIPTGAVLLKYSKEDPMRYYDGAFGISMTYGHPLDSSNMTSCNKLNAGGASFGEELACRLNIGNYYYTENGWVKSDTKPFGLDLTFTISFDLKSWGEWASNKNTKTLNMPYVDLIGYVIEIPTNINLIGKLEFEIIKKIWIPSVIDLYGFFLKDIKIDFKKKEIDEDAEVEDGNSDRIYENVVNENYINELDEIEFKISSYNSDGACYSKVMLGDKYLTDNLYSAIEETYIRPEEQLIRRIIKRYSAPRIKLTQVLKEPSELTPISRLYDNSMVNKRFINIGGTIDYAMNQFQCIMIEV